MTDNYRLLALVPSGEKVLAQGRGIVVTERAVLCRCDAIIKFENIRAWAESGTQPYLIALSHAPIFLKEWAPRYHVLSFQWENMVAELEWSATGFWFSRRDTKAAMAIRERLAIAGVPRSDEPARECELEVPVRRLLYRRSGHGRERKIGALAVERLMPSHRHIRSVLPPVPNCKTS